MNDNNYVFAIFFFNCSFFILMNFFALLWIESDEYRLPMNVLSLSWNEYFSGSAITYERSQRITQSGNHYVHDITFEGLKPNGCIRVSKSNMVIERCTFKGCSSGNKNGGSVYLNGGQCVQKFVCGIDSYSGYWGAYCYIDAGNSTNKTKVLDSSFSKLHGNWNGVDLKEGQKEVRSINISFSTLNLNVAVNFWHGGEAKNCYFYKNTAVEITIFVIYEAGTYNINRCIFDRNVCPDTDVYGLISLDAHKQTNCYTYVNECIFNSNECKYILGTWEHPGAKGYLIHCKYINTKHSIYSIYTSGNTISSGPELKRILYSLDISQLDECRIVNISFKIPTKEFDIFKRQIYMRRRH